LYEERNEGTGSWSFLDFFTGGANTGPTTTIEIACRMNKGDSWYDDPLERGVMNALPLKPAELSTTTPADCGPALYSYLREHPEQRIRRIVQQDGAPGHDATFLPGTASLLLSVEAASGHSPTVRELIIHVASCTNVDCIDQFSERGDGVSNMLFSVPIAERLDGGTRVDRLLVFSTLH
jgi:hypothetical protein